MGQRVLLMAAMIAMVVLPMVAARDSRPARGVRRAWVGVAVFIVLWAHALVVVLPMLKE